MCTEYSRCIYKGMLMYIHYVPTVRYLSRSWTNGIWCEHDLPTGIGDVCNAMHSTEQCVNTDIRFPSVFNSTDVVCRVK